MRQYFGLVLHKHICDLAFLGEFRFLFLFLFGNFLGELVQFDLSLR